MFSMMVLTLSIREVRCKANQRASLSDSQCECERVSGRCSIWLYNVCMFFVHVGPSCNRQRHFSENSSELGKKKMLNLAVAALAFQAPGIVNPAQHSGMSSIGMSVSRRDVATAALFAGAALSVQPAEAALKPCKSGAQNCWSTASTDKTKLATWTWPKSLSRTEAVASLRAVLDAYPQEGQDKVDLGGWAFATDELAESGYARLEFKSGIGNFAKFFNGGKPFVDDFEVLVEETGVSIRSSSRTGASDLGVNAKRINYIAAALRAKGWEAPGAAA